MKQAILLAAAIAVSPVEAFACQDGEIQLFGCQTLDKGGELSENSFAFCAGNLDENDDYQSIYYEFMTPVGVQLSYPENPADGRTKLFFHHYFRKQLYHARIRFENAGDTYQAYFDDNPPRTDPDEITGPSAGVRILKNGKTVSDIACGERPSSYFEEVRRATACDVANPLGEKACAYDVPVVK